MVICRKLNILGRSKLRKENMEEFHSMIIKIIFDNFHIGICIPSIKGMIILNRLP